MYYNPKFNIFCSENNLLVSELYVKPLLERIFSVYNTETHKVINFLGLKLKLKLQKHTQQKIINCQESVNAKS